MALATGLAAADAEFFETRIRPVLAGQCYGCHSGQVKQPMGGVRLDGAEHVARVVVAGQLEESRLWRSLTHRHAVKMPPSGKLQDQVLADFQKWIAEGAVFPSSVGRTPSNWAFEPLRPGSAKIQLPAGAKMLDRGALLRRVTLDLTGLPPTVEELKAFLNDARPDAYGRVVERLLASPHYGERWARHWLDLVAYAETNGHEYDNDKLAPWRYRDYVIRAFNQDLPYDQFVREHLAGDLMKKLRLSADGAAVESPLATGFLFFGEVLNSTTDPVKSRADDVDHQIDVLGKTFTGLTVACARCHDHKFDPIPTAEYYGIAGVLHSTDYREVLLDSPERRREVATMRRGGVLAPVASQVTYRKGDSVFANFNEGFGKWRREGEAFGNGPVDAAASSLEAGAPEFVGTLTSPEAAMSDQQYLHVRISGTKQKIEGRPSERTPLRLTLVCAGYKARHVVAAGLEPKWETLVLVLERNRRCYVELVDHSREGWLTVDEIVFSDHATPPETTGGATRQGPLLSIANLPPSQFGVSAAEGEGKDVRVHVRGNVHQLGPVAARGFLSAVVGREQKPVVTGSGRAELAERLTGPGQALLARVMVNRLWKHHFGEGLVKSTDNFGVMGEMPRDRDLLDGLARELISSNWSLKQMHRRMTLSDYYQSDALKPRRLEAEAVRDSVLAVSGRLDPKLFGPSITPFISPFQNGRGRPASGPLDGDGRRSIYVQIRRNFVPPLFTAFDYPPPASTVGVRGTSAVPSQALMLLNNEFVHAQAKLLGGRLTGDLNERVELLYLKTFARRPEPEEVTRIAEFVTAQQGRGEADVWADVVHVMWNSPEFVYVR